MTLEQKVAQLMVIGFEGPTLDPGLREMVERYRVGGVIFFARNVESPAQVARLTNELQARAMAAGGPGLMLAIDQEGGRVARLTSNKGFTEFPGAMAIGATAADLGQAGERARRIGAALAAEMRAVGLNTNFAPDLDVNNNPGNPVIGIRSFSSDPQRVARLGVAYIEGLQGEGVLAFGKHFPGHGDTAVDSHADLPVVGHARTRLETVEFVPFRAAISHRVAGIMSAHVSFPTIETTAGLPGTLSPRVLTELLRRDLGYDGLVATDSLEMGALGRSGFPPPRAAARALQAGADLMLFNAGYEIHQEALRQVVADVRSGTIPMARLDEAVRRMLRAKERFGLLAPPRVDEGAASQKAGSAEHRALAVETAAAAITLLRDDRALLPLTGLAPIFVATPSAVGLAKAIGGIEVRVREQPTTAEVAQLLQTIQTHPGAPVVFGLAGAKAGSAQLELGRKISAAGAPLIIVALRDPYDLLAWPNTGPARGAALLVTYGSNGPTMEALAEVLRGKRKPAGHLPVELPGMFPLGAGRGDFVRR